MAAPIKAPAWQWQPPPARRPPAAGEVALCSPPPAAERAAMAQAAVQRTTAAKQAAAVPQQARRPAMTVGQAAPAAGFPAAQPSAPLSATATCTRRKHRQQRARPPRQRRSIDVENHVPFDGCSNLESATHCHRRVGGYDPQRAPLFAGLPDQLAERRHCRAMAGRQRLRVNLHRAKLPAELAQEGIELRTGKRRAEEFGRDDALWCCPFAHIEQGTRNTARQ